VVYAGVVGAEIGTPEVGKRLLIEDIEVVTVKERVNQGEGKKWVVVNVLYLYAKEGKGKQVHQGVRICLFRTRRDAITWEAPFDCRQVYFMHRLPHNK
jgi:hypothetical protein